MLVARVPALAGPTNPSAPPCGPAEPAPYDVYDDTSMSAPTELIFVFRLPFAWYVWLNVRVKVAMLFSFVVDVFSRPSGSWANFSSFESLGQPPNLGSNARVHNEASSTGFATFELGPRPSADGHPYYS